MPGLYILMSFYHHKYNHPYPPLSLPPLSPFSPDTTTEGLDPTSLCLLEVFAVDAMSHYDPAGSTRSRSWNGRSKRSQSPMFDAMSGGGSCMSRMDVSHSMRERAAGLWLDQLRQTQERRQEAMQRKNELEEHKRNNTLHKIKASDIAADMHQQRHHEYLSSRSEAFQGRQEYLQQARNHAQLLHSMRSQQIEQDTDMKLSHADALHRKNLDEIVDDTCRRNTERSHNVKRNQSLVNRRKEGIQRSKQAREAQKDHLISARKMQEQDQRAAIAQEREQQRRETQRRAESISAMKRVNVQSKIHRDSARSTSVLQKREQWLAERQQQNQERQEHIKESVGHAQRVRKAKEKMYENHYEESLAIGRETAEHNKMFKLNNKIMHEV